MQNLNQLYRFLGSNEAFIEYAVADYNADNVEEKNNTHDAAFKDSLVALDVPTEVKIGEVVKWMKTLTSFYQKSEIISIKELEIEKDLEDQSREKNQMRCSGSLAFAFDPLTFIKFPTSWSGCTTILDVERSENCKNLASPSVFIYFLSTCFHPNFPAYHLRSSIGDQTHSLLPIYTKSVKAFSQTLKNMVYYCRIYHGSQFNKFAIYVDIFMNKTDDNSN
ncbi:hypothetical protein RF11_10579 [Thelohanellus kitauei]|uniref:Uncharacterized protein n=1 Tax=Thelohanellus kitauei TaxID=669202 RepID=A0A0C2J9J8_THEKT|nr:hypothetical protein RF11_10579 [Thelohanellus kitauei]